MAIKNRSIYAILGILHLAPSTGYDIKRYSDKVLSGFWNENFGHIYPTLKKMLGDGLIEIVSREKNQKKVRYGITEKGTQELAVWLSEETMQQPVRSEFTLKFLFSSSQPRENVIRMLEDYKEVHENNILQYRGMQQDLEQSEDISKERAVFINAVLRRGILAGEASLRWCDETIEDMQHTHAPQQEAQSEAL